MEKQKFGNKVQDRSGLQSAKIDFINFGDIFFMFQDNKASLKKSPGPSCSKDD